MKITIISGTNRPDSNSLRLSRIIAQHAEDSGASISLLDLQELPPEAFLPSAYGTKPAALKPFTDSILGADGLIAVVPEYNGSFPGVLKYFIDLLPFPEAFEGRPVAFVGLSAGQWGALRAVEQLQQVFGYRNAACYPQRLFFPGVHKSLHPSTGQLTDSELEARLQRLVAGFTAFVRRNPLGGQK